MSHLLRRVLVLLATLLMCLVLSGAALASGSPTTTAPTNVLDTSATLNMAGQCPANTTCYVVFHYRLSPSGGWTTANLTQPAAYVCSGDAPCDYAESAPTTGLTASTSYDYQAGYRNGAGSGYSWVGPDGTGNTVQTFTTASDGPPPPPPAVWQLAPDFSNRTGALSGPCGSITESGSTITMTIDAPAPPPPTPQPCGWTGSRAAMIIAGAPAVKLADGHEHEFTQEFLIPSSQPGMPGGTFPLIDPAKQQWLQLSEWYGSPMNGSPSTQWGIRKCKSTNQNCLGWVGQDYLQNGVGYPVFETPLVYDQWITVTTRILFSTDPNVGYVEIDVNGVPQQFYDGSTRYHYATITAADSSGNIYWWCADLYPAQQIPGTLTVEHGLPEMNY